MITMADQGWGWQIRKVKKNIYEEKDREREKKKAKKKATVRRGER